MIIRLLNETDVAAFKAIRIEPTQQAPTSVYQTPEEQSARLPEQLKPQLTDPSTRVFGAFDGDQLVGIAGISRDGETKRSHTARIRLLYVRPTHRGQGLARQFLTQVLDYAAAIPQIRPKPLREVSPGLITIGLSIMTNSMRWGHLFGVSGNVAHDLKLEVLRRAPHRVCP